MSLSKRERKRPVRFEQLRTPLEIVNRMQWVLHYIGEATDDVRLLNEAYVDAKDAYSKASKTHMRNNAGKGSVTDRENNAQIDNWDLFIDMENAQKALQYMREKKEDLEKEYSGLQTETKLVIAEMQMAGRVT